MSENTKDAKPVLTLFGGPPVLGLAGSASPPCMKLETWLRIAGIPYEAGRPFSPEHPPPKGKIPYILDNGALIGDSTFIVEHMKRTRNVDPDKGLSASERAIGVAFRRMLKENTYWVLMHIRYQEQANWEVWRAAMHAMMIPPGAPDEAVQKGYAMVDGIRKMVGDQMHAHGLGRHSEEEVHQIGIADVTAVSDFLGDKSYFFGDTPTGTDAAVYAYLANLIDLPFDSATTRFARGRSNLVEYCSRMRARFFGS